jgi:nitrite reductase (NADH) large subunit
VENHFAKAGVTVLKQAETERVVGSPAVSGVVLKDGRHVPCQIFMAATGIRPNIDLARDAGIPVGKGVLVDDYMRTRVRGVFAAGDVAEHGKQSFGLWPVAVEQAEAAAVNALGGDMIVTADTPATILKGVGLELFSIGRTDAEPTDDVIVIDRPQKPSYRRLVLSEGRVVGATVLGHHPADVTAAKTAVPKKVSISPDSLAALRAGDWSVLTVEPSPTR